MHNRNLTVRSQKRYTFQISGIQYLIRSQRLHYSDQFSETAMGVKVGAQQDSNSRYVRALYEVGETFMARIMRPWLWPTKLFFMSARGRRFQENLSHLHNFTRKVQWITICSNEYRYIYINIEYLSCSLSYSGTIFAKFEIFLFYRLWSSEA